MMPGAPFQDYERLWNHDPEDKMIGRVYRLGDREVMVLARGTQWGPGSMRNVLILRDDGTMTVRPFRGLRKIV
jgi:hypothetical protein